MIKKIILLFGIMALLSIMFASASVVLSDPPDSVYNNTALTVAFTYKIIMDDIGNVSNCSVYTNSSGFWAGATANDSIPLNNTGITKTVTFANSDVPIIWNVLCNKTITNTTNRTLYINSINPTLELKSINTDFYGATATFKYLTYDTYLDKCSLVINNALEETDTTPLNNVDTSFNKTYSANTISNYYINCSDKGGVIAVSPTLSFSQILSTGAPIEIGSGGGGVDAFTQKVQAATGSVVTENGKLMFQQYFWIIAIVVILGIIFWKPVTKMFR